MLKKIIPSVALLLASFNCCAAVIQYEGFSREDSSSIVIGDGLEWLKWDVTKGLSISAAISTYAKDGWLLANNQQMASLFNSFGFGGQKWSGNISGMQETYVDHQAGDFGAFWYFNALFGLTFHGSCEKDNRLVGCWSNDDSLGVSHALFGERNFNDLLINVATVRDDTTVILSEDSKVFAPSYASLTSLTTAQDFSQSHFGVALVRQHLNSPVVVSNPPSNSLLFLGILALAYWRNNFLPLALRGTGLFFSFFLQKGALSRRWR